MRSVLDRDTPEILVVGLGSIGRRHLRNLKALGWDGIRLYRTGRATLPERDLDGLPVEHDLEVALERHPLAVVVSNPSALHVPVALSASQAGSHLFLEKPLSDRRDGVEELTSRVQSRGLTALMGFHFRYSPGLARIRRWVQDGSLGAIVAVEVRWSEFLPDMHPWEDFRVSYAARADLGGGVLNTLCHPFDYLRWLLGNARVVAATESQRGALGLSVETSVDVRLSFATGAAGLVHLDFLERPRQHRLRVTGTDASAGWSDHDHAAWLWPNGTPRPERVSAPVGFERNTLFVEEMAHFLACLRGDEIPRCTLQDGAAALELVLAAKQAIAENSSACLTTTHDA